MIVCVALTAAGLAGQGWGKAPRVAVAEVSDGVISSWEEFDIGWDAAHDVGPEGSHHARIVRFLKEHAVETVVAGHMGPPMQNTLTKLGVTLSLGASGDPRAAAIEAAA